MILVNQLTLELAKDVSRIPLDEVALLPRGIRERVQWLLQVASDTKVMMDMAELCMSRRDMESLKDVAQNRDVVSFKDMNKILRTLRNTKNPLSPCVTNLVASIKSSHRFFDGVVSFRELI